MFRQRLPIQGIVRADDGHHEAVRTEHDLWPVADQDCDLNLFSIDINEPVVEVRPVFDGHTGDWGIRSRKLRLIAQQYIDDRSPRCHVSPAVLAPLASQRLESLPDGRLRALKTWLGYRYDRPAVPDSLMPLARAIADAVKANRVAPLADRIDDVLIQFDDTSQPPRFSLYAVVTNPDDEDQARRWLAQIALTVPTTLGIGDEIEARARKLISLELLETSYSADLTQLTWRTP